MESVKKPPEPEIETGYMRIGCFGGSFDPVHVGHVRMAEIARDVLQLDEVRMIPAQVNPHKNKKPLANGRQRAELLRIAVRNHPRLRVWTGELERDGPSYTIETIEQMQREEPHSRFFWIIGSDQLDTLRNWHRIEDLVQRVGFIVVARPDSPVYLPRIRGLRLYPVDNEPIPVSSTNIRRDIGQGSVPKGLSLPVARHIRKENLYNEPHSS